MKKYQKESNMNFAILAPIYFNAVRIHYEKVRWVIKKQNFILASILSSLPKLLC